jgi:hypothetical protein
MDHSEALPPVPSPTLNGAPRLTSGSSAPALGQDHSSLDSFFDELLSVGSHNSELISSHFGLSPTWRLSNPVHMEIQENAKLPTFNLDVDRTGSTLFPHHPSARAFLPSPNTDDELTTENNKRTRNSARGSLAERFLQHPTRQSLNAAYAQAGALREHQDRQLSGGGMHSSVHSSARTSRAGSIVEEKKAEHADLPVPHTLTVRLDDALVSGWEVDPTPFSEIQQKHDEDHFSAMGYRKLQLPIPLLSPGHSAPLSFLTDAEMSPGRKFAEAVVTEDAVATAAAIVSQAAANGNSTSLTSPPYPPHIQLPTSAALLGDDTSRAKRQSAVSLHDRSTSQRRRLNDSPCSEPTLDRTSKAFPPTPHRHALIANTLSSIERASKQKSQYGFGPKHVVPSVPASLEELAASKARKESHQPQRPIRESTVDSPTDYSASNQQAPQMNSGPAYERKKQKAKDARVRLNESIDKLSIAISFAGTQSKQRLDQWNALSSSSSWARVLGGGDDNAGDDTRDPDRVRYVVQECVQYAEGAKKWDRPSFVGSAALLIQSLNAQCEMLMRELSHLHAAIESSDRKGMCLNGESERVVEPPIAQITDAGDSKAGTSTSMSTPSRQSLESEVVSSTMESYDLSTTSQGTATPQGNTTWGGPKFTSRIATFLDPVSLARCNYVSRGWRREFSNAERWFGMAVERFGQYNVRQWKGKLDDDEECIKCGPFTLYNSMDRSNVMPHYDHDGMFLLGEACLPGKLAVWCFLVERSNGETHRSVLRHRSMPGHGVYASLPVVELRTIVQNIGCHDGPVVVREQLQTVDASTRRRGVEMEEIHWDERFRRRVLNLDGSPIPTPATATVTALDSSGILCSLKLFESVVIATFIHAKGCSTTSKFVQKTNYTKVHVQISNGTTIPVVVTFPRDLSHHLEH